MTSACPPDTCLAWNGFLLSLPLASSPCWPFSSWRPGTMAVRPCLGGSTSSVTSPRSLPSAVFSTKRNGDDRSRPGRSSFLHLFSASHRSWDRRKLRQGRLAGRSRDFAGQGGGGMDEKAAHPNQKASPAVLIDRALAGALEEEDPRRA